MRLKKCFIILLISALFITSCQNSIQVPKAVHDTIFITKIDTLYIHNPIIRCSIDNINVFDSMKLVAYKRQDSSLVVIDSAATIKCLFKNCLLLQKENKRYYDLLRQYTSNLYQ
jgi:hypothetical protein